jgi:D-alanyl-lipoteichoic acid acyltransferase DltB (MBOAT superfamily)
MARGIAMLLGFVLPENFRGPYTATSVRDFWSRWHMTLSRWVRDFLFQPVFLRYSGSRLGRLSSIVLVMMLVGLWHGPAWTFVLWGGVHGVALAWERFGRERRRGQGRPPVVMTGWGRFWRRFWTFQLVAFAWVFFRADSVSAALDVFAQLGSFGPAPAVTPLLVLVLIGVFAAQYFPEPWAYRVRAGFRRVGPVLQIGALGALLLVVDALGPEGVPPFIYSRF